MILARSDEFNVRLKHTQLTDNFLKITIFRDMMPCSLVDIPLKRYISTTVYSVTFQKKAVFMVTDMRTLNPT
jgi:hypothetical protein